MFPLTPVSIASAVAIIGIIGLFAAGRAAFQVALERKALERGREALRNLPMPHDGMQNYQAWLDDQGTAIADSHFAEHLRAAAYAADSGRAVSLSELHEISARREARRIWARLSGGVTALLLICGIAGTLWAIKPLLSDFALKANPDGTTEAAENAKEATRLIRNLSSAFSPSLVALGLTILVGFTRGIYAHRRGQLAGELDKLDLEDLFPRFPPMSIGHELNEVRRQLGDLATQMLASQRNLDQFVAQLSDSAQRFHDDAPPLSEASDRFVNAASTISPQLDALASSVGRHLGKGSPLVKRLNCMADCAGQISSLAEQFRTAIEGITGMHNVTAQAVAEVAAALARMQEQEREITEAIKQSGHSGAQLVVIHQDSWQGLKAMLENQREVLYRFLAERRDIPDRFVQGTAEEDGGQMRIAIEVASLTATLMALQQEKRPGPLRRIANLLTRRAQPIDYDSNSE